MRAKTRTGPLPLCAALFALAGGFEAASQPTGERYGYLTAAKDGRAAVGQAAGEFRVVAANLLWFKVVDHYHHQFMAQGGDWSKNVSLLPLLKTIIELDPHFKEAYALLGGELLPNTGHVAEGLAVLDRGIRNVPDDYELCQTAAILCARTEHRPDLALPYARLGLARATAQDDGGFSRRLMDRSCRALEGDVRAGRGRTLTPAARPRSATAAGASPVQSPPSGSG